MNDASLDVAAIPSVTHQEGGEQPHLLVLTGISKSFGSTRALEDVDFAVSRSEIVGLIGGNGAGKSTLMKLIGGLLPPDAGTIDLSGRRLAAGHAPRDAMQLGLRFVHQELSLCANLRVYENFAVELPDLIKGWRWQSRAAALACRALQDVFPGSRIDPRSKVGALSISQRQMVEIARAASHPATRLLILDEPTSSLGSHEAEQLRAFMRKRRNDGLSFIFISHRIHEMLGLADRVVVLRNGKLAWAENAANVTHARLVDLLGGSAAGAGVTASTCYNGEPVVEIADLQGGLLRGVSIAARPGQIVGLAGLEGAGQRQVLHAIFSARGNNTAAVKVNGRVAFVSGDRATEGVFPLWSIDENITLSSLRRHSFLGLLALDRLQALSASWFERLKIRAPSGAALITSLSGGNQQKAVIARALAAEPDILLLDDPTRGVDLGTKEELYGLFRGAAAQGRTLMWYSSDDTEFAQCDRTLVLRDGMVAQEFSRGEVNEARIVEASFAGADAQSGASNAQLAAERARRREATVSSLIPLVTVTAVLALSAAMNPLILTPFGLTLMFSAAFALAFAATSQLFMIAAGDIDLGLGNFIGLVNAVAATWFVTDPLLAALCFAGMLAAYPIMGLFVEVRRVPAIIVTLGLSFVWLGLAALRLPRAGGRAPDWLVDLLRIKVPIVPMPVLLCTIPAISAYLVLMVWRYGAVLRGFGANPRAIIAAGWSRRIAKATLYGFAGLFAFLAGILVTASTRGGDPTGSASLTLLSIAAVILGGAAFSGGVVFPLGALFGTLTLVLVGTLLSLLGVNSVFLPLVQGLLLLGAIGVRTLLVGQEVK